MAALELKTFKDIVDAVREEVKIQDSDSITIARIKRDVNMVYLNEVCAKERWKWLRDKVDLTHFSATEGSCTVTQGSRDITLTATIANTKKGFFFSIDEQVYKIAAHTAGSAAIELESVYTKTTNTSANFKIWTNEVPLPSDCRETIHAYLDEQNVALENDGLQTHLDRMLFNRKEEGQPRFYTTTDWADPDQYNAVSGAPAVTSRASSGLVKTLTMASDPTSFYSVGGRIEVSGTTIRSYNGRFVISSVTNSPDTITYTGTVPLNETTAADGGITVLAETNEKSAERFREMLIHPSISKDLHNIHVHYIKQPTPLDLDADEPLMPIEDRSVLLFGALVKAWTRERNPEESSRNVQLFAQKSSQMRGKLDDSTDPVKLKIHKTYLAVKRNRIRFPADFRRFD